MVRSTKIPSITTQQSEDEPMDLRVSTKAADIRFMCPLCRAICSNQVIICMNWIRLLINDLATFL